MSADPTPARRSRRGTGAVTLHEVARIAGVAPITASRVLNTPDQVSEEVRKRVQDAIAKTGYVPNRLAGSLASSRSKLVAAVVPTIAGPVFLETIQSLTEALAEKGYQLMLGQSGYADSREDALLDAIIGRRPDGIVLTGVMHSEQGRKRLASAGIPIVETWDLTPSPIDMLVGFSHEQVGRAALEYFKARGRTKLAIVSGDDERAARRTKGFVAAAKSARLPAVTVMNVPAPTTLRVGREALNELIASRKVFDGVFCSSDLLALGVMTEAQSLRIVVPDQLAVMGFGDLEFAADVLPSLTTVRINGTAIGRQAAQFIVDRAEGRAVKERVVDIGFEIVGRDSA